MATFFYCCASIWCIFWLIFFEKFKTRKQKEKLNEQKQCFLPWNILYGYSIDHQIQINKAWTQSTDLSSKYLWVVLLLLSECQWHWQRKMTGICHMIPIRPSNIAHPFYMKKGSSDTDSVLPFLCMYVCLVLAVLTLMKGQRLCITWRPNVTYCIVMKCCVTLAEHIFKCFHLMW